MPRKIIYWVSLVILLLSAMVATGCVKKNEEEIARERIKDIAEIEIPSDSKIVYHCRDKATFSNGRRGQYTVFEFENAPSEWLQENIFSEGRNEDFEKDFMSFLFTVPVEKDDIPVEFMPDFEKNYLWLSTNNAVHLFYCMDNSILIAYIVGY